MTFLDRLNNPPKCVFTLNQSGGKIIQFQQSQAVTSHFEIFLSIVKRNGLYGKSVSVQEIKLL